MASCMSLHADPSRFFFFFFFSEHYLFKELLSIFHSISQYMTYGCFNCSVMFMGERNHSSAARFMVLVIRSGRVRVKYALKADEGHSLW